MSDCYIVMYVDGSNHLWLTKAFFLLKHIYFSVVSLRVWNITNILLTTRFCQKKICVHRAYKLHFSIALTSGLENLIDNSLVFTNIFHKQDTEILKLLQLFLRWLGCKILISRNTNFLQPSLNRGLVKTNCLNHCCLVSTNEIYTL